MRRHSFEHNGNKFDCYETTRRYGSKEYGFTFYTWAYLDWNDIEFNLGDPFCKSVVAKKDYVAHFDMMKLRAREGTVGEYKHLLRVRASPEHEWERPDNMVAIVTQKLLEAQ